jgi:hypothetical protein
VGEGEGGASSRPFSSSPLLLLPLRSLLLQLFNVPDVVIPPTSFTSPTSTPAPAPAARVLGGGGFAAGGGEQGLALGLRGGGVR